MRVRVHVVRSRTRSPARGHPAQTGPAHAQPKPKPKPSPAQPSPAPPRPQSAPGAGVSSGARLCPFVPSLNAYLNAYLRKLEERHGLLPAWTLKNRLLPTALSAQVCRVLQRWLKQEDHEVPLSPGACPRRLWGVGRPPPVPRLPSCWLRTRSRRFLPLAQARGSRGSPFARGLP